MTDPLPNDPLTVRGRSALGHLHLRVNGKDFHLDPEMSAAFEHIMKLKALTYRGMFDYLMALKTERPWDVLFHLGRRLFRKRILEDPSLGRLRITRNWDNPNENLRAFRIKDGSRSSTSFTRTPADWYPKFEHVQAGDVHCGETGQFLYSYNRQETEAA